MRFGTALGVSLQDYLVLSVQDRLIDQPRLGRAASDPGLCILKNPLIRM